MALSSTKWHFCLALFCDNTVLFSWLAISFHKQFVRTSSLEKNRRILNRVNVSNKCTTIFACRVSVALCRDFKNTHCTKIPLRSDEYFRKRYAWNLLMGASWLIRTWRWKWVQVINAFPRLLIIIPQQSFYRSLLHSDNNFSKEDIIAVTLNEMH